MDAARARQATNPQQVPQSGPARSWRHPAWHRSSGCLRGRANTDIKFLPTPPSLPPSECASITTQRVLVWLERWRKGTEEGRADRAGIPLRKMGPACLCPMRAWAARGASDSTTAAASSSISNSSSTGRDLSMSSPCSVPRLSCVCEQSELVQVTKFGAAV